MNPGINEHVCVIPCVTLVIRRICASFVLANAILKQDMIQCGISLSSSLKSNEKLLSLCISVIVIIVRVVFLRRRNRIMLVLLLVRVRVVVVVLLLLLRPRPLLLLYLRLPFVPLLRLPPLPLVFLLLFRIFITGSVKEFLIESARPSEAESLHLSS